MDPVVGRLLASRYRIADRIGAGGMGVVYRAVDEQLQRPVAVKLLLDVGADRDRLNRFKNEALALSALNHPHIVTVFDVGDAHGASFIATELVDGETLRDRLDRGPVPIREALEFAMQIARALEAAHARHIVHRDIKPANVMVRRDGYVKVLDFGLAALRQATEPGHSVVDPLSLETVAVTIAGTPGYMAPEQIAGANVDARSDIFSLGVLLCETLSGTNAFARATTLETLTAIERTPEPARERIRDLPARVREIVLKALQKDPSRRYQAAAELVADLRLAIAALDGPQRMASPGLRSRTRILAAVAALVIAAAAAAGGLVYRRLERERWVREQAIPQIRKLLADGRPVAAMSLINAAERYSPQDSALVQAVAEGTRVGSIQSTPEGARVEVKDYLVPGENWTALGTTPLARVRIPNGFLRWRVSKAGVGEYVVARTSAASARFELDRAASAPDGMVPVPESTWTDSLAFLGWLGPYKLPPYFIDRYEVTNRQYQEFVDAGGYRRPEFWKQPFIRNGSPVSWADAMTTLRDTTGREGPSTWEAGHYPDGRADYPVTGISWYEAAAYAEFARKSLPVIAQGYQAEPPDLDQYVLRMSNPSETPARVGQFAGLSVYGTYDMIGNVREWYWNASDDNRRYALGHQAASYGPETLPPFDRSPLNGFRCVRNAGPVPTNASAARPLLTRDFSKARPASDEVFRVYRTMYAYDKLPLRATVEQVADGAQDWVKEKITFDAAYRTERIPAYLFLPKHTAPPYQTVLFFPSARVNFAPSSSALGDLEFIDYVIKSGRAVMYPIYQMLYERKTGAPTLPGPTLARETLVEWSKDLGRSIDYLETRRDIDSRRLGYLGVSQGAAHGVVLAALEERLKAIVFLDGGYFQEGQPLTGTDQADFAPRITRPVLMVNGRYDATFPYQTAQVPLFRMLGGPAADKRHVVFETPHDVSLRRADLVREVLTWFDRYLGRVN